MKVCVYCGVSADTRDHLIPRTFTGDGYNRRAVATVPACRECNTLLGCYGKDTIHERREYVHDKLIRRYKHELNAPEHSAEDLAEMGPTLRSFVEDRMKRTEYILARLAWPEDSDFDEQALDAAVWVEDVPPSNYLSPIPASL